MSTWRFVARHRGVLPGATINESFDVGDRWKRRYTLSVKGYFPVPVAIIEHTSESEPHKQWARVVEISVALRDRILAGDKAVFDIKAFVLI